MVVLVTGGGLVKISARLSIASDHIFPDVVMLNFNMFNLAMVHESMRNLGFIKPTLHPDTSGKKKIAK